jgi:hypothetical protein
MTTETKRESGPGQHTSYPVEVLATSKAGDGTGRRNVPGVMVVQAGLPPTVWYLHEGEWKVAGKENLKWLSFKVG